MAIRRDSHSAILHGILYAVEVIYEAGATRHVLAEYERGEGGKFSLTRETRYATERDAIGALHAIVRHRFPWLGEARK